MSATKIINFVTKKVWKNIEESRRKRKNRKKMKNERVHRQNHYENLSEEKILIRLSFFDYNNKYYPQVFLECLHRLGK